MDEKKPEKIDGVEIKKTALPKKFGRGRPAGTSNKGANYVRDKILSAFENLGGTRWLVKVAKEDPRTFCTLLAKVLPTNITGDPENPIQTQTNVTIDVSKLPDEVLRKISGVL